MAADAAAKPANDSWPVEPSNALQKLKTNKPTHKKH
jgi:hypothetical protein